MKAIRIHRHGTAEVLQIDEIPKPQIRSDEVLVQIKAAALNHLDLFVRNGIPGIPLPIILGSDGSGIIVERGEHVAEKNKLQTGAEIIVVPYRAASTVEDQDELSQEYEICGEHIDGTFAEYIAVPADCVLPKPQNLSWEESAAYPLAYMTSYHMLTRKIGVKKNDWILIWGASSGVGSAAIQIAKSRGARIIATASNPEKMKFAAALGADYIINYREENVGNSVREITGGAGVHYVFEHVGQESWLHSMRALRKGGAIITCGATTGPFVRIDLRHLFIKHLRIIGSTMGNRSDLTELGEMFSSGMFKPVIDSVYSFREIRKAHERLESGVHQGKIVIRF